MVVQESLLDLQSCVGLPMDQVATLVRHNSRLLAAGAQVWQTSMQSLLSVLCLPVPQAQAAVLAHPRLLRLGVKELRRICKQLRGMVDSYEGWREQLNTMTGRQVSPLLAHNKTCLPPQVTECTSIAASTIAACIPSTAMCQGNLVMCAIFDVDGLCYDRMHVFCELVFAMQWQAAVQGALGCRTHGYGAYFNFVQPLFCRWQLA